MRESKFIHQNKKKWEQFEETLQNESDPEKLKDVFIQVTDDLSYARTYYPNRSVRVYLNNLSQQAFFRVYQNQQSRSSRFIQFWREELPLLVFDSRKAFRLSFGIFLLSFIIGTLSCAMDAEFARIIMGDSYIEMTIKNIESGDPMAVYKQKGAFSMAIGITANNLFVALLTFITGVFFTIGSIGILIQNGVMVGAFQYFFIEKGLFQESFLTIWTHGTLEISAIVIAGAAGITMGRGIVFPGTLSRLKSFQISARRGVKILIGISPIIIMAGIIESYLTRQTDTPDIIRLGFILLCLGFVLFYFVWYPRYLNKKMTQRSALGRPLPVDTDQKIDLGKIKQVGELASESYIFLQRHGRSIFGMAFLASLVFCLGVFMTSKVPAGELFFFPQTILGGTLDQIPQFFNNPNYPWIAPLHLFLFSMIVGQVFKLFVEMESRQMMLFPPPENRFLILVKTLTGAAAITALLLSIRWFTFPLLMLVAPIIIVWMYTMIRESKSAPLSIGRTFQLLAGGYGRIVLLALLLLSTGLMAFLLLDTMITYILFDTIGMNFSLEQTAMDNLATILLTFLTIFVLYSVFALLCVGCCLTYYVLLEIREGRFLKEKLSDLSLTPTLQGLEKEA